MRHRVLVAVLAVVSVGLVACAGDGTTSGDTTAAGDLTAQVKSATLFATHRSLRLAVVNTTDEPVDLGTVQLSSELFQPVTPAAHDVVLDPGDGQVVMPLPFGRARCARDDGGATDGEISGTGVLVATVDGDEQRIVLDQSPADLLTEMHDAECAAEEVLAAVDVRLGDRWTAVGPRAMAGEITMARRDPEVEAELDEVLGNVIFSLAPASTRDQPWLVVDDADPSGVVPVIVKAARCDPHALIEYKRTFVFVARVAVDGATPVRVDVTAEDGAHRALEQLLASCIG